MRMEETNKELELSEKDVFLKYNKGKTYGNDLGLKGRRAKDNFDILSPGDRKEEQ